MNQAEARGQVRVLTGLVGLSVVIGWIAYSISSGKLFSLAGPFVSGSLLTVLATVVGRRRRAYARARFYPLACGPVWIASGLASGCLNSTLPMCLLFWPAFAVADILGALSTSQGVALAVTILSPIQFLIFGGLLDTLRHTTDDARKVRWLLRTALLIFGSLLWLVLQSQNNGADALGLEPWERILLASVYGITGSVLLVFGVSFWVSARESAKAGIAEETPESGRPFREFQDTP